MVLELAPAEVTPQRTSLCISDEGWVEKWCSRCEEWWPASTEFFSPQPGKPVPLHSWCKACTSEWRMERRATDPAFAQRDQEARERWHARWLARRGR